ncbi:hypothetical protein [Thermoanaerobacterium sp. RBIITD]|uniref:hypothetical protein n=1 Tax=Thermoanaerobacterium sp. RBIITD TaxID=1550240 RepID=UPI000BB8FF31|nr:hypothetical protein [Thermoanaerobacterium sp. RBIITD]
MGFLELNKLGIPTVPLKEFHPDVNLTYDVLWTIRVAVYEGDDLNLPRAVGVNAREALKKGRELYNTYKDKGMIFYYPFFIAEKSGTLEISNSRIIIEAVQGDLWNLVTYGKVDETIIISNEDKYYYKNKEFLTNEEILQIMKHIDLIKFKYRDLLVEGKSVLLEWSFAYNTNNENIPFGNKYLVFYEIRSI